MSLFLFDCEASAVVMLDLEKLCFNLVELLHKLWQQMSPFLFLLFSQLF